MMLIKRKPVDWTGFAIPKKGRIKLSKKQYAKLKAQVHKRDKWKCINPKCISGTMPMVARVLTIHHALSRAHGGSDTEENTVTLCIYCHDLVHDYKISREFVNDYLNNLYGKTK